MLYLLPEAGTVKWHFTAMVKSLHMQEGAQQHTLRAWLPAHGAISSSLLLPSTVGVTGWPSEGTASHW